MIFSTCALGKRIWSRMDPPPPSEAMESGDASAVLAEAGREKSEVERHVSMSDSSFSLAPTWSAPDQVQRSGTADRGNATRKKIVGVGPSLLGDMQLPLYLRGEGGFFGGHKKRKGYWGLPEKKK
jgi:hypothetical protein